jgi:hypothetical protein
MEDGMITLLAIAGIVYIWTRPPTTLGILGKAALTVFICSGGCGLGSCLGTL